MLLEGFLNFEHVLPLLRGYSGREHIDELKYHLEVAI
jgi:hypothetical protein